MNYTKLLIDNAALDQALEALEDQSNRTNHYPQVCLFAQAGMNQFGLPVKHSHWSAIDFKNGDILQIEGGDDLMDSFDHIQSVRIIDGSQEAQVAKIRASLPVRLECSWAKRRPWYKRVWQALFSL